MKDEADRGICFHFLSRQCQFPGALIPTELDNCILLQKSGEQELTRWIDAEAADGGASAGCVLDFRQHSAVLIDRVHGNGSRAPVGAVEKMSIGADRDFSGGIFTFEVVGLSADALDLFEGAFLLVERECDDGAAHFIDHVSESGIRAEGEVSRARAWFNRRVGRVVGSQYGSRRIDLEYQQFIKTEIRQNQKAVIGRDVGGVRMRSLLT